MKDKELYTVNILNTFLSNKITTEVDNFSVIDAKSKDYVIELKHRNRYYDDMLIEKDKFERLMDSSNLNNLIPLYVCSVENGDIFVFNMLKVIRCVPLEWETQMHNKSTEFYDKPDNKKKKRKLVSFIPTSLSTRATLVDGKYELQNICLY